MPSFRGSNGGGMVAGLGLLRALLLLLLVVQAPPLQATALSPTVVPTIAPSPRPSTPPSNSDPVLLSYTLDMGVGKITLTFDVEVAAHTMDVTGLGLQSADGITTFHLNVTHNMLSKQGNTSDLVIYLTNNDFAQLAVTPPLARSVAETFLTLDRDSVYSPFGFAASEVPSSQAMAPSTLTVDGFPPYLIAFELLVDAFRLKMTFSEPVDLDSFVLEGLRLQGSAYIGDALNDATLQSQYYDLQSQGASFLSISNHNRTLVWDLGSLNMNNMKEVLGLCTHISSCFLSGYQPFVKDTAGNGVSLIGFDSLSALPATNFLPDSQPPTLLYWDFDLNTGEVALTFSETVFREFFNFSRIVFASGAYSPSTYSADNVTLLRVDAPVNTSMGNRDVVRFFLNPQQFDAIKALPELLVSEDRNSTLVAEYDLVVDTSDAHNVYLGLDAKPAQPMPVRRFVSDNIDPQLLSFSLDLTSRLLTLSFSETVRLSSVDVRQITLQSAQSIAVGVQTLVLSSSLATLVTLSEGPEVQFELTPLAAFTLEGLGLLAKSPSSTWLSMFRQFCTDTAQNRDFKNSAGESATSNWIEEVPPSGAMGVSAYTPDTSLPSLISWEADFSSGLLTLTFSKSINTATLRPDFASFVSDLVSIRTTVEYTLQSSYLVGQVVNVVTLALSPLDLAAMQTLGLCTTQNSCYLSLPSTFANGAAVTSQSGQTITPALVPATLLQADTFTPDLLPPRFLNYSIDLTTQLLTLVFSEPVMLSGNSSKVLLSYVGSESEVRLSTYSLPSPLALGVGAASIYSLQLTATDLRQIQKYAPLATSLTTLNLTLGQGYTHDVAGNALNVTWIGGGGGEETAPLPPSYFGEDTTLPLLQAVYLSGAAGSPSSILALYFSKQMLVSSLQQSAVFLVSSAGATVALTAATRLTNDTYARAISLELSPLTQLQALGLAQDQFTTNVYISLSGAVVDATKSANAMQGMSITAAVRDGLALTSFRLDLTLALLSLELAFPSQISTLRPTKLTLTAANVVDGEFRLRTYSLLCSYSSTPYTSSFATTSAASTYAVDLSGPFLLIHLSPADYTAVRSTFILSTSSDITLVVGQTALEHEGKVLNEASTLPCSHFQADTTPLEVTSFDLDLALGTLRLYFSKEADIATAVLSSSDYTYNSTSNTTTPASTASLTLALLSQRANISSLDLSALATNASYGSLSAVLLGNLTVIDEPNVLGYVAPNSTQLLLSLNNYNTAAVGAWALLTPREQILSTSLGTPFLAIRRGLIYDLARPRNPSQGVTTASELLSPTVLVADTAKPTLVGWDLDLNLRTMTLYFSEAVGVTDVYVSYLTLLQDPLAPSTSHQLTTSTLISTSPSSTMVLTLSAADVDLMMASAPTLISSPSTSHLSMLKGAFWDLGSNLLPETLYRYGLPVTQYTADTTAPQLLWYNFSLQTGHMTLYFDELVNCSAVQVGQLLFQGREYRGTSAQYFQLSAGQVDCAPTSTISATSGRFTRQIDLVIDADDLTALKIRPFAHVQNTLYLRLLSAAVVDVFDNPNLAVPDGSAVLSASFEPDTRQPELRSFLVSALEQMTLFFSEPVDVSTMVISQLRVQNSYKDSTRSWPFITAKLLNSDPTLRELTFDIRQDRALASGESDILNTQESTFLRVGGAFIQDFSGNFIVERDRQNTVQLGPAVNFWDLDANTGVLELIYSEAVGNFSLVGFSVQDAYDRNNYSTPLSTPYLTTASTDSKNHITLSAEDLNTLKLGGFIGSALTPSLFLTCEYDLTRSLNEGDLTPNLKAVQVLTSNAVRIRRFTKDTTAPEVLSFFLDLNTDQLTLYLDEPTDASSLDLSQLVLSSSTSGRYARLSQGDRAVSLVNVTQLMVNLSAADATAVKIAVQGEGDVAALDQLVIAQGAVKDLLANSIRLGFDPGDPILGSMALDVTPPTLLSWTLDRSEMLMTLTFDEFVPAESSKADNFILLSGDISDPNTVQMQLSNYTLIKQGTIPTQLLLDLDLYREDAFRLEALAPFGLGTATSSAYLSATARDLAGNLATHVVQADSVIADTSPLLLQAFNLEMGSVVTVTLYLSAVANYSTFSCADLQLLSHPRIDADEIVALTDSDCTLASPLDGNYSHVLSFTLAPAAASTLGVIGTSPDSTYLRVQASNTADLSNNPLVTTRYVDALRQGPQLLAFNFDANSGLLTYVFSKSLDFEKAFNASALGFRNRKSHFLSGDATFSQLLLPLPTSFANSNSEASSAYAQGRANSTIGILALDDADLSSLKDLDLHASTFRALIRESTITDYLGISLVPQGGVVVNSEGITMPTGGLLVSQLTLDDELPELTFLSVDLGSELIVLQFSEPVALASLVVGQLCVQGVEDVETANVTLLDLPGVSYAVQGEGRYCLTSSKAYPSHWTEQQREEADAEKLYFSTYAHTYSDSLTLHLSPTDAATLKLLPYLSSLNTSYLSYQYFTLTDAAGNPLPAASPSAAIQFSAFTNDTTPPTLDSFHFDLTDESATFLTLTFSEPVELTFLVANMILQSRFASRDGIAYTLTGGEVVGASLNAVVVELLPHDITAIRLMPGLMRRKQSTYLVTGEFAVDLAGNTVVAYLDGNALSCLVFTPDRAPPRVLSSTLDMDAGSVLFEFSEPVVLTTVDVTALRVQLQRIPPLAWPINTPTTAPTSAPTATKALAARVALNRDKVDNSRHSLSRLSSVSYAYTSTSAMSTSNVTDTLSQSLLILLSPMDLDGIKSRYPMASSQSTTWFSFSLFLQDTAGNYISPVPRSAPLQVTTYLSDVTTPSVITYTLDMSLLSLTLILSESLDPLSIRLDQLVMQSAPARRFGVSRTLSQVSDLVCTASAAALASTSTHTSTTTYCAEAFILGAHAASNLLTITLSHATATYLKFNRIGTTTARSLLSWSDAFAADNAANYIPPAWDARELGFTPRSPNVLVVDSSAPLLERWFFEVLSDVSGATDGSIGLYMYFDEPVVLLNATSVGLLYTSTPKSADTPTHADTDTGTGAQVTYSDSNRRIKLQLANYCLSSAYSTLPACRANLQDLFSFLNHTSTTTTTTTASAYFLTLASAAVEDFAHAPNPSAAVEGKGALLQGSPVCSLCPTGQHVSQRCSGSTDRTCALCSPCAEGSHPVQLCAEYADTACGACASCGYERYVAAPCSAGSVGVGGVGVGVGGADVTCAACSTCPSLHFLSRPCAQGLDVVCNRCVCDWDLFEAKAEGRAAAAGVAEGVKGQGTKIPALGPNALPSPRSQCLKSPQYSSWFAANCCTDRLGKQVACGDRDLRSMQISARDGAQRWL
ncbi:hypothetical protein B484DRAFT_477684 [Ochromonadaceae sp. CCMP2298]|nr:hypothetical protein B484DRAFT_477684 [Ochromonadaceae sp. CCMP2298]